MGTLAAELAAREPADDGARDADADPLRRRVEGVLQLLLPAAGAVAGAGPGPRIVVPVAAGLAPAEVRVALAALVVARAALVVLRDGGAAGVGAVVVVARAVALAAGEGLCKEG